jgi:hypothetical protein
VEDCPVFRQQQSQGQVEAWGHGELHVHARSVRLCTSGMYSLEAL